mgnify:FL=1|jgi:uroporphyrin-III C-methyltransferase
MSFQGGAGLVCGTICLVGAGPGAADLLTLRAMRRLMAADVVFHDRLVSPEVLALIPGRARVVDVGKAVGANAWPQGRINAEIVTAALMGLAVVRLKSGDPSIFGRAAEEIGAAAAAGIPVEVVPGITAASAAAAATLDPLTVRGRFDRVVFATGTTLTSAATRDLAASLVPGTKLVLYMAVAQLAHIEADLLAAGVPGDTPATITSGASTSGERTGRYALKDLAQAVARDGFTNPAVIMLNIAKDVSGRGTAVAPEMASCRV